MLTLPNFADPFILETDACNTDIGAVLMQQGRPIAYFSSALGPKSAAQSIYEKEATAILMALKKWRHYLLGNKIIIRTDQQSLKFITSQRLSEGVQHKLLLKLLEFDYTVEYKKGRENKVADALSRRDQDISTCLAISSVTPDWKADITASYSSDPNCQKWMSFTSLPNSKYSLSHGVLRYKGRIVVGTDMTLKHQIFQSLHASAIGGHSGQRATYQRVKRLFYWPHLKAQVLKWDSECPVCQMSKVEHVHVPGLLQPLPVPDLAWSHITMDFIKGLPKSKNKVVILVVVDRLTKYAHFLTLSHPFTVHEVVDLFLSNIFKLHGLPVCIITDRDRIFTSALWQDLFKALKVELPMSTSYHPRTDG